MTTCILVAKIITCTIVPGSVPTPADAAKILKPYEFVYHEPLPNGPTVIILSSDSREGPFGPFPRSHYPYEFFYGQQIYSNQRSSQPLNRFVPSLSRTRR